MTIAEAQETVLQALFGLPSSGDSGFEGFVAAALTELTGHTFHVTKSGPQGGIDARSAPHNLLQVGAEAKQYSPSTQLPLSHLLHKITDASTASTPVDLWLLAATRRVGASDQRRLHEHGLKLGMGVAVVDCPADLTRLADLAVVCTSARHACNTFFLPSDALSDALERIRQAPGFGANRTRIVDRLTRADTGYASVRIASERWMQEAQTSLPNAKSRLGGHHDLLASVYGVIPRAGINAQLDDWYSSDSGIAALLGDEGMGKTWAALYWHAGLVNLPPDSFGC